MKLPEWAAKGVLGIGPEPWARQVIARTIRDLGTDEDPEVFAMLTGSTPEEPLVTLRVLAALTVGLATVRVTTDPAQSKDAELSLLVVPWQRVAPTLQLQMLGDPEERLPLAMTIGDERIEARHDQRPALTAFFLEASRIAKS